jgi:tRNA-Thr(GGU) m(6)t(6)A37 methyltransferase TsaA
MVESKPEMTLQPIGWVSNELKQPGRRRCEDVVSEIVIDSNLSEALDGLEDFSHIIVLYWMNRLTTGTIKNKIHPHGEMDLELVGLFATRSPRRPNSIGVTTVRLLERQGNILKVKGLDAIDGTPVIDIKPHLPGRDSLADARVPQWLGKQINDC